MLDEVLYLMYTVYSFMCHFKYNETLKFSYFRLSVVDKILAPECLILNSKVGTVQKIQ